METKSVASAIQLAHYWKHKQPLSHLLATHIATEVIGGTSFPKYLEEWLDHQVAKRNEAHPIVRFLVSLHVDFIRG